MKINNIDRDRPRDELLDPMSIREVRQKRQTKVFMAVMAIIMLAAAGVTFADGSWRALTGLQLIGAGASAVLYLASFSSLLAGEWTIGMVPPGVTAVWGAILALRWGDLTAEPKDLPQTVLCIFMAVLTAVAAVFVVLALIILLASLKTADLRRDADRLTLVVLGFRLADGKPAPILVNRLKRAAGEMKAYPEMHCILTGGRINPDEPAESEVMRDCLLEMGIEADRLTVENRSTTTYENIRRCKAIAAEKELPPTFAIVTDRFHQYRVRLICRSAGVESVGVNSELPLCLLLQYWSREVLCLLEKWIRRL